LAEVPERVRTRTQLTEEAIQAALDADWKTALELNQEIVERFPADEETNNRLGKAYTELGKLDQALSAYRATLELNPLNVIAIKNVNRLEALLEEKAKPVKAQTALDVNLFVEEMGKTALAAVKPEPKLDVALLAPGDHIELVPQGDRLQAQTESGVTIGDVEAKIARRVLKFMAGGNKYAAAVATAEDGSVRIMIRETFQAAQFAGVPSFPVRKVPEFRAYAKDSLLRDTETAELGEGEDLEEEAIAGEVEDELEGLHPVEPGTEDAADFGDEDTRQEENY